MFFSDAAYSGNRVLEMLELKDFVPFWDGSLDKNTPTDYCTTTGFVGVLQGQVGETVKTLIFVTFQGTRTESDFFDNDILNAIVDALQFTPENDWGGY